MNKRLFQLFLNMILIVSCACLAEEITGSQQQQINAIQQNMRKDLSEGRIDQARSALEQAAGNFHSVQIELGLIQTLMQAGEYRHALSAAAHTQAEHPDVIDSSLFYAWLLAIGGQMTPAIQLLQAVIERHPDNNELNILLLQIKTKHLDVSQIITSEDIQLRPFVYPNFILSSFRHIASGLLINNNAQVITPLFTVEKAKKIRVRNGLGKMVDAHIEQALPAQNLVVLALDSAMSGALLPAIAAKTPFPGSLVYVIGYSQNNLNQSNWPQLSVDILGMPTGATLNYTLHLPAIAVGSGVYDQSGQLIGMVIKEPAGGYTMMPIVARTLISGQTDNKTAIKVVESSKKPMDEIFESVLGNAVQILVDE